MAKERLTIVMIGATGAVGTEVVRSLTDGAALERLTLLGRRPLAGFADERVAQHVVDVLDSGSYRDVLSGHQIAVCTLGVGQPSKVSKEQFIRIDKQAVLDFAAECKATGVRHFELLCSVGADASSRSFFLRAKGELQDGLIALDFDRLSLFQPSMILTQDNRYGIMQALTLIVWPRLRFMLIGPLRKYRGVPVERLGKAIANNAIGGVPAGGVEMLQWDDFVTLAPDDSV